MGAGWLLTIRGADADVELEQLDEAGLDWFATGPGGDAAGTLAEVVPAAVAADSDPEWVAAVLAAIERDLATVRAERTQLLVIRATGTWFHVTFAENRASIMRHGLDWRRMAGGGIAGSIEAEWPGVFLCADLEDADFSRAWDAGASSTSGRSSWMASGWREIPAPAEAVAITG